MPPEESSKNQAAKSWLNRASEDLRAANWDFKASPPLLEDVLFHCQQAVEKSLKAFLVWHDTPFRKTHDLQVLGNQCVKIDSTLEAAIEEIVALRDYAWEFRYPSECDPPSTKDAKLGIKSAETFFRVISRKLK